MPCSCCRSAESEDGGGGDDTSLPGFCFKM